ncbi:MAG TPA: DUF1501 domain-containing protein, partial [Gemmataceae bacterium]|nr:DUF1501 domain-containing protein [Gemmataceae bacterium]
MTQPTGKQHCGNFGPPILTRRDLLRRAGMGFGTLALASLLLDDGLLSAADPAPENGLLRPTGKARSVIFLFMGGGPSQVDTWDPKPELTRLNRQNVPESIARGVPRIARAPLTNLYASPYRFTRYGQSGIPVSAMFPEIGRHVDDICVLRSCRHSSPIHAPAEYLAMTGTQIGDRPSLGSWLYYGLGSENRDLPGFVVMISSGDGAGREPGWSSGFLPARYQGTVVGAGGIPNLAMPAGTSESQRRAQLDLIADLNRRHLERHGGQNELEARIRSYEMAFRMQTAAPAVFDLSRESQRTKALYGIGQTETNEFGTFCLLARRLVERGVRFVQLRSGGWDAHGNLAQNHTPQARKTDRPIAALLADLKARGLLDSTLVVWGGEFGRTPTAENPGPTPGRNHSPSGYSMWLAGGGVRGGQVIGATDPVGYAAIERPIHPNDLHATILHALGIDQQRLYYQHHNRRELVTVNGGE